MARYKEREDKFIIENYQVLSDREIGRMLGRTTRGILMRRVRLNTFREQNKNIENYNSTYSIRNEIKGLHLMIDRGVMVDICRTRLELIMNTVAAQKSISKRRPKVPLHLKAKSVELYRNGARAVDVAEVIGVNPKSVHMFYNSTLPTKSKEVQTITLKSKV